MKRAAHLGADRGIDQLVLGDSRLARKLRRNDVRGIVVAIAGEVADGDVGVRQGRLDEAFDLARADIDREYEQPFWAPIDVAALEMVRRALFRFIR